ncbi:hypothetical protein GALMADRAFT_594299 [Galerina marginata CBS 339.88]|uniref:Uncharacterized protein n=1 Tax=Galerina marginata (strain CBS 339.88) TaxID=685588 RepID=A0A067T4L3_GALM3|nr:hypothetical protein GALMADRAFT_594299 [Galerina marginata CBS 339.88]
MLNPHVDTHRNMSCTSITVDCEDLVGLSGFRQNDFVIAIMGPTGTGKSNVLMFLLFQVLMLTQRSSQAHRHFD